MPEKLVRDRIDAIMREAGVPVRQRIANDKEWPDLLHAKLREECDEFTDSPSIEELADIVEVVHALAGSLGTSWDDVEQVRLRKRAERGAFTRRLVISTASHAP